MQEWHNRIADMLYDITRLATVGDTELGSRYISYATMSDY